jgi:hypothetical protein
MRMRFDTAFSTGVESGSRPWDIAGSAEDAMDGSLIFGGCSAERLPQPTGCGPSSAFAPVTMKTTDWAIATA